MVETALPMYELGWIPNMTMWEDTLAFLLNLSKLDPLRVDTTASAKMQQAIEAAQAAGIAQTAVKELGKYLQGPDNEVVVKQLEGRLEGLLRAITEVKNLDQVETEIDEAEHKTVEASRLVGSLVWLLHKSGVKWEKKRSALEHAWSEADSLADSARACLISAVKTLGEKKIRFAFSPRPFGKIFWNGDTGDFKYDRDVQDHTPFDVTFSAIMNGKPLTQTITITPVPQLPSAAQDIIDQRITGYVVGSELENRYTPIKDGTKLFLTGLDLTLEKEHLEGSLENLIVFGHIVRIPDKLTFENGAVSLDIFARYVVFAPGASIDVSGKRGEENGGAIERNDVDNVGENGNVDKKDGEAKPTLPPEDGKEGKEGKKGRSGQAGGRIRIVAERIIGVPTLIANGGPGEKGTDGEKGHTGVRGERGKDEHIHKSGYGKFAGYAKIAGKPGDPGGKGGKGGKAGQRGDHGDGGNIFIHTVLPCPKDDLQVNPGQDLLTETDKEASGGPGGDGGAGGIGGTQLRGGGRYSDGSQGSTGDVGDDPPPAKIGERGKISRGSTGYSDLCSALVGQEHYASYGTPDSALISMVLFAAERLYLNAESEQDIEALGAILDYLLRVTAVAAGDSKIQAIHKRCSVLKANLAHGLDYFGKAPDYVDSLSFNENELFYTKFKDAAKDLEADYDKFWEQNRVEGQTRAAVISQIHRADALVVQKIEPKRKKLESEAKKNEELIDDLTKKAISKTTEVMKKVEEFKEELRRKQSYDTLIGVLSMAYSFVIVGTNVKPLLTNGLAVFENVFKEQPSSGSGNNLKEEKKNAEKGEEDKEQKQDDKKKPEELASAAFGKVKGSVQTIVNDYHRYFQNPQPTDLLKLALDEQDRQSFDKEIDRFLDIPKAEVLKEEVHKYFELVMQRNKAILERDSEMQQAYNIQAQIELIAKENTDLRKVITSTDDPTLPTLVQYMNSSTQLLKSYIIETLYMMSRSANCYTLENKPLRLTDYRVSTLEQQYAEIVKRLQEAARDNGPQSDSNCTLFIDDEAQLEQLRQYEPVWFSIPLNTNRPPTGPFGAIDRPMVYKIECYFDGLTSPSSHSKAVVTVEHSGFSYSYNEATGEVWSFTHAPRTILLSQYETDKKREGFYWGDLTEAGKHMMLSPFTVWGVQFKREAGDNGKFDLSTIKRVELQFSVKGKATPIH